MTFPLMRRVMIGLIAVCLAGALSMGCQKEVTVSNDNDNQAPSENDGNDGEDNDNDHQHNDGHPYDDDYFEEHGPDDDQELIEVGTLQGSWRAASVEGDVPVGYFDIFHDEGATTASGDFMMGPIISDMQDGNTGSIDSVTIEGDSVTVEWNPTNQEVEMYRLVLEREDEDTYTGHFEAEQYPEEHDVSFERQVFEDEEEE